jgi:hypothetical protein
LLRHWRELGIPVGQVRSPDRSYNVRNVDGIVAADRSGNKINRVERGVGCFLRQWELSLGENDLLHYCVVVF